ncbi:MAG TPA: hypothetical protein VJN18_13900 [Polyangiaceae bacterium]|nr:hypothetical protein [Polyangiaceae bacterium]
MKQVPFIATDSADRPLPYPAGKRAAELLGHSYHHIHGLDFHGALASRGG